MNWRAILLLALGHFLIDFCQGIVPALVPFLVEGRHFSYTVAASLVFAMSATSSVVQPVFGQMADRLAHLVAIAGQYRTGWRGPGPGGPSGECWSGPRCVRRQWSGSCGLSSGSRSQGVSGQRPPENDRHEPVFHRWRTRFRDGARTYRARRGDMGNRRFTIPSRTNRNHRGTTHAGDWTGSRFAVSSPGRTPRSRGAVTIGKHSRSSAAPQFAGRSCSMASIHFLLSTS